MGNVQKSMRIPDETVTEIQSLAEQSGKDFSAMANELLKMALRMHRCPGVVFAEGTSGRRARVAGTGIEVWEIIACYKSVDCSFQRLKGAYHWLSELQLRSALGYYHAYADEIDEMIRRNEDWTMDKIQDRYPFLFGTGA